MADFSLDQQKALAMASARARASAAGPGLGPKDVPESAPYGTVAQPSPQPMNTTLLRVVMAVAVTMHTIQRMANDRVSARRAKATATNATAGSRICASPKRVAMCQKGPVWSASFAFMAWESGKRKSLPSR